MLSNWETLSRLLLAAILGSAVGFERERLLWAAGIRTHMVVCVGACLLMIVSAFGFADALVDQHVVLDPSRVAAQVVSGIGFLGAGSILARGEIVRGLTTAASIWTVAAIGLAIGGGLYFAGTASTVIIIGILAGVKPLEEAYRARNQSCRLHVVANGGVITPDSAKTAMKVRASQIKRFAQAAATDGVEEIDIHLARVSSQEIGAFIERLRRLQGVRDVKVVMRDRENGTGSGW
jgi:putative Mg2+ transporter-C (MgtC) family protein